MIVVATFRGGDSTPKELFLYHDAGLDGGGGGSYIDSVILVDRDLNGGGGWMGAADGVREKRYYPIQNWRADVVAVTEGTGIRMESVRYSPYGAPTVLSDADYDQDGDVDSADETAFNTDYGGGTDLQADLDWNGAIDGQDDSVFDLLKADADGSSIYKAPGDSRGTLSIYGLRKGYAGYENDGVVVKLAHVRNRVLDHETGRWTRRDPAGYVDGVGLYEYVDSNGIIQTDPMGFVKIRLSQSGDPAENTLIQSSRGVPNGTAPVSFPQVPLLYPGSVLQRLTDCDAWAADFYDRLGGANVPCRTPSIVEGARCCRLGNPQAQCIAAIMRTNSECITRPPPPATSCAADCLVCATALGISGALCAYAPLECAAALALYLLWHYDNIVLPPPCQRCATCAFM